MHTSSSKFRFRIKPGAAVLVLVILFIAAGIVQGWAAGRSGPTDFSACPSTTPEEQAKTDDAFEAKLKTFRAFMKKEMERWEIPGVGVGIVKGGKVIFAQGFGLRDVEKNLPVTPDTIFAIGSASKAFTSMDIGILVDEGKVEWDEPVQNYLPSFKLKDEVATARMTVRDLVCHKSGLPRHDAIWYGSTSSRKDIFDRLQHLEFSADFRQTFQYNNLMFLTAGYLVGQVTGSSWEESGYPPSSSTPGTIPSSLPRPSPTKPWRRTRPSSRPSPARAATWGS